MGLLVEDEESRVGINPDLPSAARDRRYGMARLPLTITDLVLRGNEENQDLARLLAWYLAQDVGSAPGDWESLSPVLGRQVGSERLDLTNNARFGQFKYWVCFLGFGWCHVREGKEWLVPDPTAHLRRRMAEIFGSDSRLSPAQAMQRLAEVCPVFEGGWARRDVEDQIGQRPERTISSATAHAWFRLQDEGLVEVEARSADADVLLFPEGERTVRCSALIRRKTGGAR